MNHRQPEFKNQALTIYDKVLVADLFETTADQKIYHPLDKILINCIGQRSSVLCKIPVLDLSVATRFTRADEVLTTAVESIPSVVSVCTMPTLISSMCSGHLQAFLKGTIRLSRIVSILEGENLS